MRVFLLHLVILPLTVSVAFVCFAADSVLSDETVVADNAPPAPREMTALSLPQHLFQQLPAGLSPQQQTEAMSILTAAGPRIIEAQVRVTSILEKLRELSFSAHSHADQLTELGQELVVARDALRAELGRVSNELEKGIGLNPEWDRPRSCSMPQAARDGAMHKN